MKLAQSLILSLCLTTSSLVVMAFVPRSQNTHIRLLAVSVQQNNEADINVLWEEDDDDDDDDENEQEKQPSKTSLKSTRWDNLNPKLKARIVKTGQERAIANKQKTEGKHTQKRRMMMFMKQKQREKKNAARVPRPLGFDDRAPLSTLIPGMEVTGVVISLTNFGAYIDVGSECDGLLHISQLSTTDFIEHPRQVLTPGQEVTVRVRSVNGEKKKLHLTMLPTDVMQQQQLDSNDEDRIALEDIEVDDELWGELKRVTNYGAYVDVGAAVSGFMHFMDHPLWTHGATPREIMKVGDRVRVWVSNVDLDQRRIKLTANRPEYLPGPRREV